MTLLTIALLLRIYCRPTSKADAEFIAIQFSASGITDLLNEHLIEESQVGKFTVTDKGVVYIEALRTVPLPIQQWVIGDLKMMVKNTT